MFSSKYRWDNRLRFDKLYRQNICLCTLHLIVNDARLAQQINH